MPEKRFPKLYATAASNGKVKEWETFVQTDEEGHVWTFTRHGYQGMKITETKKETKKGKNIGRSNETTPFEQAVSEAQSKWNKKHDNEGYVEDLSHESKISVIFPMLALDFTKRSHNIVYPCFTQPKFDGIRCVAFVDPETNKVVLQSRKGKPFVNFKHLEDEITEMKLSPSICLDGELFSDKIPFEDITGIVRKENHPDKHKIQYRIYDCVNRDDLKMPFKDRINKVRSCSSTSIIPVLTEEANGEADIHQAHHRYVQDGHEGVIIRNADSPYQINVRSKDLQKLKHFQDAEYPIVGFHEGTGVDVGTVVWECRYKEENDLTEDDPNDGVFRCRPRGSREKRARWLEEGPEHVKKRSKLTVRFQELTNYGCPRFPVGIEIRDYE